MRGKFEGFSSRSLSFIRELDRQETRSLFSIFNLFNRTTEHTHKDVLIKRAKDDAGKLDRQGIEEIVGGFVYIIEQSSSTFIMSLVTDQAYLPSRSKVRTTSFGGEA